MEHHTHAHQPGLIPWLNSLFHIHNHTHDAHASLVGDPAFKDNELGIRTVWFALIALFVTTVIQIGIAVFSRSVALLADTAHNIVDVLNSVPLLIAFYLARRAATRRYTYGFGKAEDVAGIFIVLSIVTSAGIILWESLQKLFNPQPIEHWPWVALAAVVGFVGNELVAWGQIRVGRKIGSEAMVSDGLHARIDGLTSLVVLVAVLGTLMGLPILDPIVGLMIGVVILFISKDTAVRIWYRLMDAVDPRLVDQIEQLAAEVDGVQAISCIRVRWVGHALWAELTAVVPRDLSFNQSHTIATTIEDTLRHTIPHLTQIVVQLIPNMPAHRGPINQ